MRFLALAGFYYEFWEHAWGTYETPDYSLWVMAADEDLIDPFHVGRLVGRDNECEEFYSAIEALVSVDRSNIVHALECAYGDKNMLFVALWNSNKEPRPAELDEDDEEYHSYQETPDEVLNDPDVEKQCAYDWLDQGAL